MQVGDICSIFRQAKNLPAFQSVHVLLILFWCSSKDRMVQCNSWRKQETNFNLPAPFSLESWGSPKLTQQGTNGMSVDKETSVNLQTASKGVLSDVQQFVVYRILRHSDDLNPRSQLFPKGSVRGCYLVLLEPPFSQRKTDSWTRTVAIARLVFLQTMFRIA